MKKIILVVAMVFATSSLVNAKTGQVKVDKEAAYSCGDFADAVAHDYAARGYDYYTVWFAAYGHCAIPGY